jgi:hypothetical protein
MKVGNMERLQMLDVKVDRGYRSHSNKVFRAKGHKFCLAMCLRVATARHDGTWNHRVNIIDGQEEKTSVYESRAVLAAESAPRRLPYMYVHISSTALVSCTLDNAHCR